MQGIVVSYRAAGYGWANWDGKTVYVHITDTRDKNGDGPLPQLKCGWKIEFDVTETPRGLRARNVRVVDPAVPNEAVPCQSTQ